MPKKDVKFSMKFGSVTETPGRQRSETSAENNSLRQYLDYAGSSTSKERSQGRVKTSTFQCVHFVNNYAMSLKPLIIGSDLLKYGNLQGDVHMCLVFRVSLLR